MADGKACCDVNCGYVTETKVPDDMEMQYKLQLMQLQMQELQIHQATIHPQGRAGAGRDDRVRGVKAKMDTPKLQTKWLRYFVKYTKMAL